MEKSFNITKINALIRMTNYDLQEEIYCHNLLFGR